MRKQQKYKWQVQTQDGRILERARNKAVAHRLKIKLSKQRFETLQVVPIKKSEEN